MPSSCPGQQSLSLFWSTTAACTTTGALRKQYTALVAPPNRQKRQSQSGEHRTIRRPHDGDLNSGPIPSCIACLRIPVLGNLNPNPYCSPNPCALSMATQSRSLSFSRELYSGSSSTLKQVWEVGSRAVSGPPRCTQEGGAGGLNGRCERCVRWAAAQCRAATLHSGGGVQVV